MSPRDVVGLCGRTAVLSCGVLVLVSCWQPGARLTSDDLFTHADRAAGRFDDEFMSIERRQREVSTKLKRVRAFLASKGYDGLLLTRENMFGWITAGGENFIVHATEQSTAKVLVTSENVVGVTTNIEANRLAEEVVNGLGFAVRDFKYYEPEGGSAIIAEYCSDLTKVVTDAFHPGEMQSLATKDLLDLLYPLTPQEIRKYRWLGRKCSEVIEHVAEFVRPGMTENDVQYLIARELWYWDIFPTVNLASVDQRVRSYKHPFPAGAKLEKFVNLNVCARRWGIVVSMSRLIHFGEPDAELDRVFRVGGRVMAAMLHVTRPGNTFSQVLKANEESYADGGYPQEWQRHLQGGPILTGERVTLLRNVPDAVIKSGMALAYNPTCNGSKHEDTFIVMDDGYEILTPCIEWPKRSFVVDGKEYEVPDLKIIK